MKHYKKPKIMEIPLDMEQAVLQVCVVGGQYFNRVTTPICVAGSGPLATCMVTAKGTGGTLVAGGLGAANSFAS
ncbi:MAG: hypothetical protein PHP69_04460 [Candidatus Omnitrophica bacterium]|nr:hypothetical protein [Candidatus Omnitrophota bacterium]MDD5081356.1 hypothetical protein [Candidatus Omnitrophota bacterium]MDD5441568.1 hypothetical protein [Candidatus Omnitrophota bacterium]